MKLLQCDKIKELDRYTIEHESIQSIELMERAAQGLTDAISKRWNNDTEFIIFAGPGNNGGDALAVARMLIEKGYKVETYLFNTSEHLSADCECNRDLLKAIPDVIFTEVNTTFNPPLLSDKNVIIDGLFGSGLNKPLSGGFANLAKYINAAPAKVVALDIPSGLNGDGDRFDVFPNIIVKADLTLSIQIPKIAFLFAENQSVLGQIQIIDIKEDINAIESDFSLLEEEDIKQLIKPRDKFAHKGIFGHALLIAGSYGMAGASILTAKACLRSGVGLLTIHAPACNVSILQTAVPEAMIEPDIDEMAFSEATDTDKYQAIAIGPGLKQQTETADAVFCQISECQIPMVIDADALNILSQKKDKFPELPEDTILTPHAKELERLTNKCENSYERLQLAITLACETKTNVILKGAFSAVISPTGKCRFNSTGNPGMATGGSGDVLTGINLALLAQGYEAEKAAIIATYVHGLAGDIAANRLGMTAMTAMDVIDALPDAWKQMNNE